MKQQELMDTYLLPLSKIVNDVETIQTFMTLNQDNIEERWEQICKMLEGTYLDHRSILLDAWTHQREKVK